MIFLCYVLVRKHCKFLVLLDFEEMPLNFYYPDKFYADDSGSDNTS